MIAACGMTPASFSVCTAKRTLTNAPGQSRSSLLSNSALTRTVPECGIDGVVDEAGAARKAAAPVGQPAVTSPPPRAQRRERIAEVALRQAERDGDRVELRDRHQRVAGRLHEAAGEDVDRAGAPGAGAAIRRVRQADLRRLDRRAVGGDDGALRVDQRLVGVDRALRDEVLRQQVLAARELALGIGKRRLVLGELRLRLGDVDLVVARVEREQRLAGAGRTGLP